MDSAAFDIIVSGHLCLDLIPDLSGVCRGDMASPGRLTESGPIGVSTGGTVSNTGLALHRLGARVGLMASVGDDLLGKLTVDFLRTRHPDLTKLISTQSGQSSSYSVVLAPLGSDRSFLHYPGTNASFSAEHIDYLAARSAKIFHLGYPPLMPRLIADDGRELLSIYAQMKEMGLTTSMDMVVPDPNGASGKADWSSILERVLPQVDVFLPSIDEALFMLRRADYDRWNDRVLDRVDADYLYDLAGELLDLGVVVAGFKLGAMGLFVRTADATSCRRLAKTGIDPNQWSEVTHWQPAYDVTVAGTTGAGDAAYAGFLAAMLQGLPPSDCLKWASAVGACNVEAVDATSGVRTWEETARRIDAGWVTRQMHLPKYNQTQKEIFGRFQPSIARARQSTEQRTDHE